MDLESVRAVLSRAEQEVFFLAITSLTPSEIAEELVITRKTVHFHLANIYKKTKTKSRIELITRFVETGRDHQKLILYVFQIQKELMALKEKVENQLPTGRAG